MITFTLLGLIVGLLPSCGPSSTSGGFDSPNPASRMYAMERAARNGDRSAVRDIVELLDADDDAVRMLAIGSLERLTGETHGYRHYDPPEVRREAIQRWRAAVEAEEENSVAAGESKAAAN